MNESKLNILVNILFCAICSIFSIIDSLNAIEYYVYAEFHSSFFKISCLIFIIAQPIMLLIYYLISLLYLCYISDFDFEKLTSDYEYYEMIFFRKMVRNSYLWVFPLTLYLSFLGYTKFFALYSLRFLLEAPRSFRVFKNVITTTLYHSVIIQSIFQTVPQIVIQVTNNLLINEDRHHMRGVLNFSTLFSLIFLSMNLILYLREKPGYTYNTYTLNKNKSQLNLV